MSAAVVRKALLFLFLLFSVVGYSQSPTPNTLLWRIGGKGLAQPSYLYGTMHLQDKRLFQFGDSVYHAIEQTAGLATEIDLQAAMDSLFNNREAEAQQDSLLARQKIRIDRRQLHPSVLPLLKKFGVTGNVITAKQLKDIHEYRLNQILRKGEMPTIVDGFLLGLAQRQAKWTGGIEDVDDQLSLSDEIGAELKAENVLQPETAYRTGVDSMIGLYLRQDLDKIDDWCNREFGQNLRDLALIRRNVKMAYRMDSLSAVRPTFFAVGAAHLPGDSGVIALLRSRGFQVQPVFSTTKIDGNEYASRLGQKEWTAVQGHGNAYTVQMPGTPTDISKAAEGAKMKLFFDLTSMTFYMAGTVNSYDPKTKTIEEALQEAAKNINENTDVKEAVAVDHKGLKGMETVVDKDGFALRLRIFAKGRKLFLLMAGAPKKETVTGADADRFFRSFVPGDEAAKTDWKTFSPAGKAFTVRLPGTPEKNPQTDSATANDPVWDLSTFQSTDPLTDLFYMVQVRNVKPGYTIDNDVAYFNELVKDYESRLDTITRLETADYKGYPALYMNYEDNSADGEYKSVFVVRGNQVHLLLGGARRGSDLADVDSFLHSLTFLPYERTEWTKAEGPGFSLLAPSALKKLPADSSERERFFYEEYNAYNEKDGVSYIVQKRQLPTNYWAINDSVFFADRLAGNLTEEDSLLQKSWVQNGSLKGLDFTIQPGGHSGLKNVRMLVNKDTLYTLFALIQSAEYGKGDHLPFFETFRVSHEVPPAIYENKAAPLLQALTANDSTAFADAYSDFNAVSFRKEDLPLLHKALLANYYNEEEFYSAHSALVDRILPFADHSTIAFVENEYPKLQGPAELNKYRLLQLLAKQKTETSFALLKRLLLQPLPKAGNPIVLQKPLLDTLQLTATLFPQLLQQASDSLFATVIAVNANQLLDSSLLTRDALLAYKSTIIAGARNEWKLLQDGLYEPWELIRWARLLGWLNVPEGTALLRAFLTTNDGPLKQAAVLALLKNGYTVPAAVITQVAADRSARLSFYEALQGLQKQALFPPLYATQKSLAESEVYNLFTEDYDTFTLTYIGQRTAVYDGGNRLFHLFKVSIADEEKDTNHEYLCVAGPYKTGAKEKVLYGAATGVYSEEYFHPQKINEQLKAYLLQLKPAGK